MRLLFIFVATILISCSQRSKESSTDNEFIQFVTILPKVSVPFEIYCEKCCVWPEFDRENELVKKFTPEGSTIIGLFFRNEKYVGILVTYPGDMIIPSVVIYDNTGKRISEKNFMTSWCGRDYDYLGLQYFRINSDYSLNLIDTSYSFKMDSLTNKITDTVKIEISKRDFYINADGQITEK